MLKKIWAGIKSVLEPIGKFVSSIVNFVLLAMVYFIGIGIVSVIMKLFGKHFLELKSYRNKVSGELKNKEFLSKQNKSSNWHEHKLTKQPLEQYYRTF